MRAPSCRPAIPTPSYLRRRRRATPRTTTSTPHTSRCDVVATGGSQLACAPSPVPMGRGAPMAAMGERAGRPRPRNLRPQHWSNVSLLDWAHLHALIKLAASPVEWTPVFGDDLPWREVSIRAAKPLEFRGRAAELACGPGDERRRVARGVRSARAVSLRIEVAAAARRDLLRCPTRSPPRSSLLSPARSRRTRCG
jgi:hypothetical protein